MSLVSVITALERFVFARRPLVIAFFSVVTLLMALSATRLRIDAGFTKLLPLDHEYMQTFIEHREEFSGANKILVAVMARDGDMFTPEFFETLREITDEVFFIPGVSRPSVQSLWTPNTRFAEVVEGGISGGNVIPDDFEPDDEGLARVRENILKARILGRLVANYFSGAIVSAELLEVDPTTGETLDYKSVADALEGIRQQFETESSPVTVHIIGFAKLVGDIRDGALRVLTFFAIALLISAVLVWTYTRGFRYAVIPLACSIIAVIWQLGLLPLLGFGIDPMSILVPFLVFAIGVSHGIQMVSAVRGELFVGADSLQAARSAFRRLVIPGVVALASDTVGFVTIMLIDIGIIREMAITAGLGVAMIILTNLMLLPVLLSYVRYGEEYNERVRRQTRVLVPIWRRVAGITRPVPAALTVAFSCLLLVFGLWKAGDVEVGDLQQGSPELRADSRYNRDAALITERFSIGVDLLSVIVETVPEACVDHEVMSLIDRFAWHVQNVPGVQSAIHLPALAKIINAGWNEGSPDWRVLPRDRSTMAQAILPIDTSSGLLNHDCSVMPVLFFTTDHKADTIERVIGEIKRFKREERTDGVDFRLASGNVGVMAVTNEAVQSAQAPILVYVFAAVVLLCLLTFRSWRGTLCIMLPLGLVSILTYALMAITDIGLKVFTLPVVALGAGIGVDYGIYVYNRIDGFLDRLMPLEQSYRETLAVTGVAVLVTGGTMAVGVATWIFSPLKFQADMGLLLTFVFFVNMLGATLLLPALARFLMPRDRIRGKGVRKADDGEIPLYTGD
jgi:predicted RND superfamily exporter protein